MFIFAILAALIAAISPFAGLIFTIYFGLKYQDKLYVFISVFIGGTAILFFGKIIDPIRLLDIIVGIGLVSFLFIRNLLTSQNYLKALLISIATTIGYAIVRQLLFYKSISKMVIQYLSDYNVMLNTAFENNPEQLKLFTEATSQVEPLFTTYYVGVWSIIMIIALFISAQIISKKSNMKWQLRSIQMPFYIIYGLIFALILFLIPNTQKYAINGFMVVAPLFLIQGISILAYHWGEFFKRSKFLLIILIMAITFNPCLIVLLILIGLSDIWFNFRKIRNGG